MSGANHWLDEVEAKHSAYEKRLLDEIVRLRKSLGIIANGINLIEHASEIGIDCTDCDKPAIVMRRIAAHTLKDSQS